LTKKSYLVSLAKLLIAISALGLSKRMSFGKTSLYINLYKPILLIPRIPNYELTNLDAFMTIPHHSYSYKLLHLNTSCMLLYLINNAQLGSGTVV